MTTRRTTTGETPYSLVFETEAVLPIEHKLISFWIQNDEPEDNEDKLKGNLDLLEEKQSRIAKKSSSVPESDEVLAPNWEGPYQIKAMLRGDAYKLENLEGYPVDHTWNADHLRKFYL
ncbi:hypothetical protein QYF36_026464 [Acer negundo]|nr:hypothetical protein QYF36_026464 [Acer negundo]